MSDVIGNTSALSPAPDFIGWLGVKVESEEYLTTHGASQTFFSEYLNPQELSGKKFFLIMKFELQWFDLDFSIILI